MTQLEALKELLVKVEAGGITYELWTSAFPSVDDQPIEAYNGSVDAALSLFEAVLPGWGLEVGKGHGAVFEHERGYDFDFDHEIPARALLIAIIKALIAKLEAE